MNLRDLQYLVSVAKYRHFGKAAEACNVSQPSLSMQIKKLEDTLGVQLFERTNKHVMVTSIGKEIAIRAKKILCDAEEIEKFAKTHHDPFAGEIRIGAFPTLAPYFFPNIVPKIIKALPKLKLLLVEEKTDILINKIQQGEIDAAFLALPVEGDDLENVPLFDDPFLLAVPSSHSLAHELEVRQSDIVNNELLLLEDGHCLRSQALEVCRAMKAGEHQDFRATSLETLRQMVASGIGITLIPKLAVQKHKDIKYIPFMSPSPSRTIGLAWRKTSARITCFQKIAKIASKVYSAES